MRKNGNNRFAALERANYEVSNMIKNGMSDEAIKAVINNNARSNRAPLVAVSGDANNPLAGLMSKYQSANFRVSAKRLTANIAEELPIPIFLASQVQSGFQKVLPNYLPSGVTITDIQCGMIGTTVNIADLQKLRIEYTSGANVDVIEVTSNGNPYPTHLQETFNNFYDMCGITYKISDSTQQTQFDATFEPFFRSIFGKQESNELQVSSWESAYQFKSGIVEVTGNIRIDSDTGIILGIIPVANFTVSLNAFVSAFKRYGKSDING